MYMGTATITPETINSPIRHTVGTAKNQMIPAKIKTSPHVTKM
jgi:hypothetical protein